MSKIPNINLYLGTGWSPGRDDAAMFELLAQSAEARAMPTVGRWLCHMASFSAAERKAWQ